MLMPPQSSVRCGRRFTPPCLAFAVAYGLLAGAARADSPKYDLASRAATGDASEVRVELEVGGELLVTGDDGKQAKLPLTADAELAYREKLVQYDAAGDEFAARAVRRYSAARATIQTNDQTAQRTLPKDRSLVAVNVDGGQSELAGLDRPLTREQFDLINVVGNTVALGRLLPGETLAEGESWRHDDEAIRLLLGLQEISICEVSSVVDSEDNGQVQLRLAGSVRGVIDGAKTKIELKGAYLFDPRVGRITKFNLAVKEKRSAGLVAPGLDVVAQVKLTATPAEVDSFAPEEIDEARRADFRGSASLIVDSPSRGYRFQHGADWYVTGNDRNVLSLRMIGGDELIAHCNIATAPARDAGRQTQLDDFQRDIAKSLGKSIDRVVRAREWTTAAGHRCLGVFADGKVKDVPVQWRYYLLTTSASAGDKSLRASVAVTVQQSQLPKFADADRAIIDSLQLFAPPTAETALK